MNDEELLELAHSIAQLPEYRRKELAILILSTTLNSAEVVKIAGYMSNLRWEANDEQ